MKNLKLLTILFFAMTIFISCNDDDDIDPVKRRGSDHNNDNYDDTSRWRNKCCFTNS